MCFLDPNGQNIYLTVRYSKLGQQITSERIFCSVEIRKAYLVGTDSMSAYLLKSVNFKRLLFISGMTVYWCDSQSTDCQFNSVIIVNKLFNLLHRTMEYYVHCRIKT